MLTSLGQVLPEAAAKYGDKTALIVDGRRFSFRELDDLSSSVAAGLVSLGVAPGDRVTLYAPNSWEWLVSYYGTLKTGAVINTINVMLTPTEVVYVMRDCGAKVLIGSREKLAPMLALKAMDLTSIVFGKDMLPGSVPFDEFVSRRAPFEPIGVEPDQLSTICYTSGTTGRPKGAMQSHGAVILNCATTAQMYAKSAADIAVSALPCPHVYGNVGFNGAMMTGLALVLHSRFDAAEILGSIQVHRATIFEAVPTMYMYMLARPDFDRYNLSTLTRCIVGGQTMAASKMQEVERRFHCPLIEIWGMTEISGAGTTFRCDGTRILGSIGKALPNSQVRIASATDSKVTLPPGEVGELMFKGPTTMMGYYGNEAATREAIEPDDWPHTGDLASMDDAGHVFIIDRKKDMINSAGFKVFPAEIERVVASHPSVAMVAVGAQPDELKGEVAKAYVVLKPAAAADSDSILDLCRKELAAYKVPRAVQFVADLPKTSTGKIMRRELKSLDG